MPEPQKPASTSLLKRTFGKLTKDHIVLLILTVIHGINNYIWLMRDKSLHTYDAAKYLTFSYQYHELFANPTWGSPLEFFTLNQWRPPLRLLLTSPFYAMFGYSDDVAVMTNIFFMVILLFSVYGIGKYMFNRQVGLLAAIMVSLFPIVHGLSRSFLSDFAHIAMVSLSIYLLLKTEYFTNKKYSILFGLSLGLGLLTRDTFIIFMLGPLLYIMYKSEILKVRKLIRIIIDNWLAFVIVIISAAAIGAYLYYLFSNILFPWDTRFNATIFAIVMSSIICTLFIIWLFWSTTLSICISSSLKSIMFKVALSLSPFLILFCVYIIPNIQTRLFYALFAVAAIIFIIVNLLLLKNDYMLYKTNSLKSEYQVHPWLNFNRAMIMGFIIAGWWYIPTAHRLFPNMLMNPTYVKPHEGHVNIASWESISYYFLGLLNQQIYLFAFILIACFLIFIARYGKSVLKFMRTTRLIQWPKMLVKADWRAKLTLIIWISLPYILFSLSHTKNSRYIAPYLPAIAIGMAAAVLSFPKRWQKVTAVIIVLVMGGFQMAAFSYGVPSLPDQVVVDTPLGELLLFGQEPLGRHQYVVHPGDEDWYIDDALNFVYEDHRKQVELNASRARTEIQVGVMSDGTVNIHVFEYKLMEEDLPIELQSTSIYEEGVEKDSPEHSFYDKFETLDYIIELQNYTYRPDYLPPVEFFHEAENYSQFESIKDFQLPDDSTLVVYRRISV
ncbi:MAG: glycosyltransferase family 39 protein [Thermoplasmata archaeon]|nr:MAG: glycosyltransferase family 39 protein [Thermoplasmata archaeon]